MEEHKKIWRLRFLEENVKIKSPRLMVLCMPSSWFGQTPQSMADFQSSPDNNHLVREALMYVFLEIVDRMNKNRKGPLAEVYRDWGEVYMELVPRKETPEEESNRRRVYQMPTMEDIGNEKLLQMLTQWEPGKPIAEIRFWCVITNENARPEEMLNEMMEASGEFLKDVQLPEKRARLLRTYPEANALLGEEQRSDPFLICSLCSDKYMSWRKITYDSKEWTSACAFYREEDLSKLSEENFMERSSRSHPESVFSTVQVFNNLHNPEKIPPLFLNVNSYFTVRSVKDFDFRFADHGKVVRVTNDVSPLDVAGRMHPIHQLSTNYDFYMKCVKATLRKKTAQVVNVRIQNNRNAQEDEIVNLWGDADEEDEEDDFQIVSVEDNPENHQQVEESYQNLVSIAEMLGGSANDVRRVQPEFSFMLGSSNDKRNTNMLSAVNKDQYCRDPLKRCCMRARENWAKAQKVGTDSANRIFREKNLTVRDMEQAASRAHREVMQEKRRTIFLECIREEFTSHRKTYSMQLEQVFSNYVDLRGPDLYFGLFADKHMTGKVLRDACDGGFIYNDPSLSCFGHIITQMLQKLEHIALVANVHNIVLECYFSGMSALRYHVGMNLHILIQAPKDMGKSFLLHLLNSMFVPGVAMEDRSSSARANNSSVHRNGVIVMNHEKPLENYVPQKGGSSNTAASEKIAEEKQMHTEGCLLHRRMRNDGSGKVDNVVTECRCCYISMSNYQGHDVDPAYLSRHHEIHLTNPQTEKRSHKATDSLAAAKKMSPPWLVRKMDRFTMMTQMLHALFMMTEKYIEDKCIHDVTLNCTNTQIAKVVKFMRTNVQQESTQRLKEKTRFMARILVIFTALCKLFFFPDSKYANTPFRMEMLLDLDPLLCDTVEIACYAITTYHNGYENIRQNDVCLAMAIYMLQLMKNRRKAKNIFYRETANVFDLAGRSEHLPAAPSFSSYDTSAYMDEEDNNVVYVETYEERAQIAEQIRKATEECIFTEAEAEQINQSVYDFSRVKFSESPRKLATVLNGIMASNKFKKVHSTEEIYQTLYKMSQGGIPLASYGRPSESRNHHILSGFVKPVESPTARTHDSVVNVSSWKTGPVTVHYSVIENALRLKEQMDNISDSSEDRDSCFLGPLDEKMFLHDALINTMNMYTIPQKVVLASTYSDHPFIAHCLQMKRTRAPADIIENPYFMSESSKSVCNVTEEDELMSGGFSLMNRCAKLNCGLDVYSFVAHMQDIYHPIQSSQLAKKLVPAVLERARIARHIAQQRNSDHPVREISYPDTSIDEYEASYNESTDPYFVEEMPVVKPVDAEARRSHLQSLQETCQFFSQEELQEFMNLDSDDQEDDQLEPFDDEESDNTLIQPPPIARPAASAPPAPRPVPPSLQSMLVSGGGRISQHQTALSSSRSRLLVGYNSNKRGRASLEEPQTYDSQESQTDDSESALPDLFQRFSSMSKRPRVQASDNSAEASSCMDHGEPTATALPEEDEDSLMFSDYI